MLCNWIGWVKWWKGDHSPCALLIHLFPARKKPYDRSLKRRERPIYWYTNTWGIAVDVAVLLSVLKCILSCCFDVAPKTGWRWLIACRCLLTILSATSKKNLSLKLYKQSRRPLVGNWVISFEIFYLKHFAVCNPTLNEVSKTLCVVKWRGPFNSTFNSWGHKRCT